MNTWNIFYLVIYWTLYGTAEHHGRYGVLILDSYPDVRLFHSLLRGDFPSRSFSTAAMASGVTTRCAWLGWGESVTELLPFMNFLVHSYTYCSDRLASPYWTFIRRWISMGFIPSLLKKRMTEHSSCLVHVASGAAIFTLLLRRRVAFLHRTYHLSATLQTISITDVNLQTIELFFELLSHF